MIAKLILASWLLTQQWSWDKSPEPNVVAYRIYWSALGTEWCSADSVEIPATQCDATRCWGETLEPNFSPAFFIVTAVNDADLESDTEHGPILACP